MIIKIKLLSEDAVLPHKATPGAAAYDITAPRDCIITCGRNIILTDIAIELPSGYEAQIRPRSGFSAKGFEGYDYVIDSNGHIVLNSVPRRYDADVLLGTIDSDHRGCIGVIIDNSDDSFIVRKGTRIAQMVINKVEDATFSVTDRLSETSRGEGGFGHTGTI